MNERFTRLFTLAENGYTDASPLLIAAGALLRDNQNNRVLVQLKLKNLGDQDVRAVQVRLWPFNAMGREAQEPVEYTYLDLNAARGGEFGTKNPIPMPDPTIRSFRAEILEAAFADGSHWTAPEGTVWAPLPAGQTVEAALGDGELVKELRLRRGEDCRFVPTRYDDLWRCACGEIVRGERCPACGKAFFQIDLPELTRARDARMAAEQAAAERAAAEAAEKARQEAELAEAKAREKAEKAEKAKAKRKKVGKLLGILIPVAILIAAGILLGIPGLSAMQASKAAQAGDYLTAIDKYWDAEDWGVYAALFHPGEKARALEPAAHYQEGEEALAEGRYEEALAAFEAAGEYSDAAEHCSYVNAILLAENGEIEAAADAFAALGEFRDSADRAAELYYQRASQLQSSGMLEEALAFYEAAGDYADSAAQAESIRKTMAEQLEEKRAYYSEAEALLRSGDKAHAAMLFYKAGNYQDARERCFALWEELLPLHTISASGGTLAIQTDGTILHTGNYEGYRNNLTRKLPNLADKKIISVSYGAYCAAFLSADRTVYAYDLIGGGALGTSSWRDIVKISADCYDVVGLKADGTVVFAGDYQNNYRAAEYWTDIVDVAAGGDYILGLKADGTVVAAGDNPPDVSGWNHIVAISAGFDYAYGVKEDGTVVAAAQESQWVNYRMLQVGNLRDVVSVSTGLNLVAFQKADGTVAVISRYYDFTGVSSWRNIVAVSAGESHIVGLRADGTLVAEGLNEDGECNVGGWWNIRVN